MSSLKQTLEDAHVLGARSLGAATHVVGHLLAFTQILEPTALDSRRVKEQVLSTAVVDKSEAFVGQTLDHTFRHRCLPKGVHALDRARCRARKPQNGPSRWIR